MLFTANPALLWVAITAHGWTGAGALRVGFGDDCAAAGGLVRRLRGGPRFLGDALADPLTGVAAATAALRAVAEGVGGLLDCALAGGRCGHRRTDGALIADLILRNVHRFGMALHDIAIADGRIVAIGAGADATGPEIDGRGQAVLEGLVDHHIHLLATAARLSSVDLAGVIDAATAIARLRAAARAPGTWVRAVAYDERAAGLPDAATLSTWLPDHPLRMQDRTGALWLLNARAVALLGVPPYPPCVEIADGMPTGRIWRGDAWLRTRLSHDPPSLAALGAQLARFGITGVTDAGADNGPAEATLLADELPQRLMLMGREDLPESPAYLRGPLKLLLDDRDLPAIADLAARIAGARAAGRAVAAHCVTAGELVTFLAALDDANGARRGDRIEHGSVIPAALIARIAAAGLTVVTQPGFVRDRGDRYRVEVDPADLPDLYRLRTLIEAGVAVAAGSDAPYGSIDPWHAIGAATTRQTRDGALLGAGEAIDAVAAVGLYHGTHADPGGSTTLAVGAPADLVLLARPLAAICADGGADAVALTLIAGKIVHDATQ